MHITVIAVGSRGDVQPYIALAEGLRAAGHNARVATHQEFAPLLAGRGLEHALVRGNPRDLLHGPQAYSMMSAQGNPLRFLREFTRLLAPGAARLVQDAIAACEGTDALVLSNAGLAPGFCDIAEALRLPCCLGLLQPFLPTRDFASPFLRELPTWLGRARGPYNVLSHHTFLWLFRRFFGRLTRIVRREMGLPSLESSEQHRSLLTGGAPIMFAFSPSVVPRPEDWPAQAQVTGYWFLERDAGWQPPTELTEFLAAGPPPVYVGFGSMTVPDPAQLTARITEALDRAGQRAIMLAGSGALLADDLPETVLPVESAPHDWLLPRTAAVVHHCGAGTTAAGLRAGVPSVPVPFFADQPFWARTIHRLGVAPRPVPRRRLSAARLARTITQAVTDQQMRARAADLGERIRAEAGVTRAVEIVVDYFGREQRHRPERGPASP